MKFLTSQLLVILLATSAYAAVGDVCSEAGTECDLTLNTACVNEICQCVNGFSPNAENTCDQVLNADCTINPDLCSSLLNSECRTDTQTCECIAGSLPAGVVCNKVLGGVCPGGIADCETVENSECSTDGLCQCKGGYKQDNQGLQCNKVLDGSCETNADCGSTANAECNSDKRCVCSTGFKPDSQQELCNKVLTGECDIATVPSECASAVPNSECKDSLCSCVSGFVANSQETMCLLTVGGPCVDDDSCADLVSAVCTAQTCACKDGFSGSTSGTTCLKDVILGGACVDPTQCITNLGTNSTCPPSPSRNCACLDSYHYIEEKCYQTIALNGDCTDSIECQSLENPEKYECIDNTCSCSKGNKPDVNDDKICVNSAVRNSVTLAAIFSAVFVVMSRFNTV